MKCPKCRFAILEGMKFCGECGSKLDKPCPACGYSNPPQFKFCGECGQALSLPPVQAPKGLSVDEKIDKIQRYLPKGLTEGFFRFESLGQKTLKGKKEPVKVYRVIAPSSRRTRFDVSAERGLTPFVGRNRELDLLIDGFDRAKAGKGLQVSGGTALPKAGEAGGNGNHEKIERDFQGLLRSQGSSGS